MFRFDDDLRIYLHREPIDFRAGLNTLVTMVEQSMQLDPLARAVFAFHNRKRDRVKLLLYDRAGFWLMLKRLEVDRFAWPRRQQAVIELTVDQLHLLLDGVDIDALRRQPEKSYVYADTAIMKGHTHSDAHARRGIIGESA
ncbi:IS66 family insertion sequence element accessory protein TnpB [Burkholderia ubonensis]|uniref:IS66 family insertion sequence element accessory protein TnpB n=2 Tax=Burkholderia ubonensis TaxID=101571 RepID=UPI000A98821B|nr:IS66 family insertion sequence element accessory protein TnpB [Burkholderia ubonensis]